MIKGHSDPVQHIGSGRFLVAKSIMRVVRQMGKAVGHACHRWRATSHGYTPLNPRAHTIKTRPLVIERRPTRVLWR
jgi:hypothetical protein